MEDGVDIVAGARGGLYRVWEMRLLSNRFHACKSSRKGFVSGSMLYLMME